MPSTRRMRIRIMKAKVRVFRCHVHAMPILVLEMGGMLYHMPCPTMLKASQSKSFDD